MHKSGIICLSALVAHPQNALAVVKAGVLQVVVAILNENGPTYHSHEMTKRSVLAVQLLSCLAKGSDAALPYREHLRFPPPFSSSKERFSQRHIITVIG